MARPERAFRTPAIVLRRRNFGEADRLLTVLTPQHSKLDVIAKGARKPSSRKTGHVELYARVEMLVHQGRELGIVVQAEQQEPFLPLREDLTLGAYAGYAAELMDRFTEIGDDQADTRLFDLLNATLGRLCSEPDARLVMRFYELRLLDLVGFRPELAVCAVTRKPVVPEDQYFSATEGGVVCAAAGAANPHLLPLSLPALKVLRHLQRSRWADVASLSLSAPVHDQAERVMLATITHLLERRLQSAAFIARLRAQAGRVTPDVAAPPSPPESSH